MAREGLRYELMSAFQKALRGKATVTLKNIVVGTNGGTQISLTSPSNPSARSALEGMVMILYRCGGAIHCQSGRQAEPRHKARRASGRTGARTQPCPSGSANHPRRDADFAGGAQISQRGVAIYQRGMQSTNEELTTSKEEMQSMNEELQTVNNELQANVDELSHTNNDMKNLLDSTDIATLFLDNNLRVPALHHTDEQDHPIDLQRRGTPDYRHRLGFTLPATGR